MWLQRQLNDPYVTDAKRLGYRSRAAFKLTELDDRFRFPRPAARGRSGSPPAAGPRWRWSVAGEGRVVGLDIRDGCRSPGQSILRARFLDEGAPERLKLALGGEVDAVLRHGRPRHRPPATDHMRIMALGEAALDFAVEMLKPGGVFVGKVLQGG